MPSLLFMDTLARVGLPRLAPMLDRVLRWDQDLNWGDQQELVLASAEQRISDARARVSPSFRSEAEAWSAADAVGRVPGI